MNKPPRLIILVVFITVLMALWLFSAGLLVASEGEKNVAESLPDTEINKPRTGHEKDVFFNLIGMVFVSIPQGKFSMGSPPSELGRTIFEVQNEVFIDKPFYIQTTEVTQRQWEEVMGDNPSYFSECGGECPVENVSWLDVQKFINKLDQMDSSSKYRLPTEAEWEFACRSGSSTAFSTGDLANIECHKDNRLDEIAWYHCNSEGKTHPVGQKAPNDWGIFDMHGNVYEWCQDVYVTDYDQILNDVSNDTDPLADKVGRSCSFGDVLVSCRSAARVNFGPNVKSNAIGFRLVREPVYYKVMMPPSGEKLKILEINEKNLVTIQPGDRLIPEKVKKKNGFTLQIAAMKNKNNADQLVTQLEEKGYAATMINVHMAEKDAWFLVQIGSFAVIGEAKNMQINLMENNFLSIIMER